MRFRPIVKKGRKMKVTRRILVACLLLFFPLVAIASEGFAEGPRFTLKISGVGRGEL